MQRKEAIVSRKGLSRRRKNEREDRKRQQEDQEVKRNALLSAMSGDAITVEIKATPLSRRRSKETRKLLKKLDHEKRRFKKEIQFTVRCSPGVC